MTEQTTTSKSRVYICMWDENGFEVIKDCTSWERESFLNTIAGKQLKPAPVNLKSMTLRARFNPQRNYEIWTFNTEESLDEETLWQYADANPQALVDMIRERGKRLYGDTKPTETRIR
jgi:hypothetical protein